MTSDDIVKPEMLPSASPALQMIEFWRRRQDAIPGRLIERAKYCLLDAIGRDLFGSRQAWGEIMSGEVFADASQGP